jgi:hypothetical protein
MLDAKEQHAVVDFVVDEVACCARVVEGLFGWGDG